MSTFRLPILGWATLPDSSGNVFFQPAAIFQANDLATQMIAVFADTATKIGLGGRFTIPKNYANNAKAIFVWTANANSGNVQWVFDYRPVGGSNSLDPSSFIENPTGNNAAPGTGWNRVETSLSLNSTNFGVDNEVIFVASRDGANAGDNMAANAFLFQLLFEYTDV